MFGLVFIFGSWAKQGFPVMALTIQPLKPSSKIPVFGDAAVAEAKQKKEWVAGKTNQGDDNAERNKLRSELVQAAVAYKLSPCGDVTRKNFIEALTNYTKAWHAMAWCTPGVGTCPRNQDERIDTAAAIFHTPADIHVREAVGKAFRIGGIGRKDFPEPYDRFVFYFSDSPLASEPQEACLIARHAAGRS